MNSSLPIVAAPMIFVTGASRSGTTLMSQVLGRHSEVKSLRELHFFGGRWSPNGDSTVLSASEVPVAVADLLASQGIVRQGRRESGEPDPARAIVDALPRGAPSAQVFAATVTALAARAGKQIPCEQTPRNIYYASSLLSQFPAARFVHLLRDPRAVMASQKLRWRKRALLAAPTNMSRVHQARLWFNHHPYLFARLWNTATSDAWQLRTHPRLRLVKFEQLVSAPESTVRELCAFLQIDFEPQMLDVEHTNSSHVASTGLQAGFRATSIDAWQSALTREDLGVIAERCGKLMRKVGYAPEKTRLTHWAKGALALSYAGHLAGALALNPQRVLIQSRAVRRVADRDLQPAADPDPDPEQASGDPHAACGAKPTPCWPRVFGLTFMDTSLELAADQLVCWARSACRIRVAFINAHSLNVSVDDPGLRHALLDADILFADGAGMLLASLMQGRRLRYNVNGTDLFPHLADRAATAGVSIALLGGAPGVADRAVQSLHRTNPDLHVAYSHDGYFDGSADAAIVDAINASGATILLVAMGVPLQEQWIREHDAQLETPVVIGVGALFDFVSGGVPRAPSLLRRLKCEWLYRLAIEPRRLFRRYILGNPVFVMRALRYSVTGRLWSESTQK